MKLKNHKPRRNNEHDGLYVFTLSINNLVYLIKYEVILKQIYNFDIKNRININK